MAKNKSNSSGMIPQAMSEKIRDLVKSSVQVIIPGHLATYDGTWQEDQQWQEQHVEESTISA